MWSVYNDANGTGATITGNTLSATAAGTVIIRATITDGIALGTPYIQEFTLTSIYEPVSFIITASAGANGSINPESAVTVNCGANQTFTFTPNPDYVKDKVFVNGAPVAVTGNSYTFKNVSQNNTIEVTFKEYVPLSGYTVTLPVISCIRFIPTEGSESPVAPGGSFSFTVEYGDCYDISYIDVFANGVRLTPVAGIYTITDISDDQVVTVRVHK